MTTNRRISASAPAAALPLAHLGGWLWVAYLLPVVIVVVPLIKNHIATRKEQNQAGAGKSRKPRR